MAFNQYSLDLEASSSQYASISDASQTGLDISGSFTIEAWIKLEGTGRQSIVGKGQPTNGGTNDGYILAYRGDLANDPLTLYTNGDSSDLLQCVANTSGSLEDGKWHHIAATVSVSGGTATEKVYIDFVDSTTSGGSHSDPGDLGNADSFYIGRDNNGNYTDGIIGYVRLWSDARTQEELESNAYTIGLTPGTDNLIDEWQLNGDYTSESGNNDLTASNSPTFVIDVPFSTVNSTDWSSLEIQSDSTKVSGTSNLTNFPALISDSNLTSTFFSGLQTGEVNASNYINHPGLRAYYRMNTGAITADSSGNGFTLTNNNTVGETASGKFGYAADFGTSNTNKSLSIANDLGVDGGSYTMMGWFKLTTEIGSGTYCLAGHGGATSHTASVIYYQYNGGTRRLYFLRDRGGVASQGPTYNITLGTSDFYHIAMVFDGSTVKGYVNGYLVGSAAASGNGSSGYSDSFYIGEFSGGNYASQIADDVTFFNEALTAEEIKRFAQGGGDLRITSDSAGENEVPFEIVDLDIAAETAEIWAKVPTLSYNSATSLYLWYGNTSTSGYLRSDPFGLENIWDANVERAYHLQPDLIDSTSNNYTGVDSGSDDATGKISEARDFVPANDDYIEIGTPLGSTSSGTKAVELWVNIDTATAQYLITNYDAGSNGFSLLHNADRTLGIAWTGTVNAVQTTDTVTTQAWVHLVAEFASGATGGKIYIDGQLSKQGSLGTESTATNKIRISGRWATANSGSAVETDGTIDEVRIHSTTRTADWWNTSYNNQNTPDTFWTVVSSATGGKYLSLMGVG